MHRGNPAEPGGIDIAADLVAHRPRRHHRHRSGTPVTGQRVPHRHPTPAARRVPPTLLMRYFFTTKAFPTGQR
jgi:hypothetical protein